MSTNTVKTIPLDQIDRVATPVRETGTLGKWLKKMVTFVKKTTGTNSSEILSSETETSSSIFSQLVQSTQNLLNKTENIVDKVAEKGKHLIQSTESISKQVVKPSNTVLQKGIEGGRQLKERSESLLETGINFWKDIKRTIENNTQWINTHPLQSGKQLGKELIENTIQLWKNVGTEVKELGKNSLENVATVETLLEEFQSSTKNIPTKITNRIKENTKDVVQQIKTKSETMLQKTKHFKQEAIENTKDLLVNPVEYLDTFTGKGISTSSDAALEYQNDQIIPLETIEKTAETKVAPGN